MVVAWQCCSLKQKDSLQYHLLVGDEPPCAVVCSMCRGHYSHDSGELQKEEKEANYSKKGIIATSGTASFMYLIHMLLIIHPLRAIDI